MKFFKRDIGFTLAEVLITLGIIGVVAAITMPALVQNYRKHVVETRLEKFYSIMNQAAKQAELSYGEFQYWDNETSKDDMNGMEAWWNRYFAPYVKTLKIEKDGQALWVYLTDGSGFYIFNYYGSSTSSASTHIYFYPFISKRNNSKVVSGKDFFVFFMNPKTNEKYAIVEPYKFGWDGKLQNLITGYYGCKQGDQSKIPPHYCAALIQANGWKIPKDYPFSF